MDVPGGSAQREAIVEIPADRKRKAVEVQTIEPDGTKTIWVKKPRPDAQRVPPIYMKTPGGVWGLTKGPTILMKKYVSRAERDALYVQVPWPLAAASSTTTTTTTTTTLEQKETRTTTRDDHVDPAILQAGTPFEIQKDLDDDPDPAVSMRAEAAPFDRGATEETEDSQVPGELF